MEQQQRQECTEVGLASRPREEVAATGGEAEKEVRAGGEERARSVGCGGMLACGREVRFFWTRRDKVVSNNFQKQARK
jgi:hypothetical protein